MATATFTDFNIVFFKGTQANIKWYEKKGILKIRPKLLAEIKLDITGISGQYEKYQVTIIHTDKGQIATAEFLFKSYLTSRNDSRTDYTGDFKVIEHCGPEWYIAIPNNIETKHMVEKMLDYIDNFK